MRICVCGGRDFHDYEMVKRVLNAALKTFHDIEIVHGCAKGADSLAGKWADEFSVTQHKFPADWDKHKKAAGPIRNREMLKFGFDLLIAFPGGNGTADMVRITEKAGIKVYQPQ